MSLCLIAVAMVIATIAEAVVGDPNIDIININDVEHLPDVCRGKECPSFSIPDVKLPNGVQARDYPEMNWISSSRYPAVNNNCLDASANTPYQKYYFALYNYFKGVNTMGLLIDRTVPIRIIGQMDPETGEVANCHVMFYIPDMYSVNAPAPLSVDIFVGNNWKKQCFVVKINGSYTWKRAFKIYKALKSFLAKKNIKDVTESEMVLDIYSGYGVPNSKKYSELMICKTETY